MTGAGRSVSGAVGGSGAVGAVGGSGADGVVRAWYMVDALSNAELSSPLELAAGAAGGGSSGGGGGSPRQCKLEVAWTPVAAAAGGGAIVIGSGGGGAADAPPKLDAALAGTPELGCAAGGGGCSAVTRNFVVMCNVAFDPSNGSLMAPPRRSAEIRHLAVSMSKSGIDSNTLTSSA